METDFLKFLPAEITTKILLKLSVRTIAVSKCVCKPWLHLLESDDFIASHFAQSAPALALKMWTEDSKWLKLIELDEDEIDLDLGSRDPLTRLAFPHEVITGDSANGLLFLCGLAMANRLYICNPITREFIELLSTGEKACGFGVSRISGQHKVVSIDPRCVGVGEDRRFQCHVYTLGTGSWRLVEATDSFDWDLHRVGTFVHGNLHWMVLDDHGIERISCFDLETERFTSGFTVPPLLESHMDRQLYTLKDSLSFCEESSEREFVIWMMKEYGVEQSWTKEYVIDLGLGDPELQCFQPIKVYENGDLLFLYEEAFFYYSKETESSREVGGVFGAREDFNAYITSMLHTPSMVSLKKCFGSVENVISF